jgi:tubulin polyglutamylase TTLL4
MNIDYDGVFQKIKDLIIKSIISIEPIIVNNMNRATKHRHLCFELYGYDVLIDQNLRPWLVEVNVLPSFSSSSPLDKTIKTSLVTDVFNTIGVVPYSKKKL